jgi:hypothetical protein
MKVLGEDEELQLFTKSAMLYLLLGLFGVDALAFGREALKLV